MAPGTFIPKGYICETLCPPFCAAAYNVLSWSEMFLRANWVNSVVQSNTVQHWCWMSHPHQGAREACAVMGLSPVAVPPRRRKTSRSLWNDSRHPCSEATRSKDSHTLSDLTLLSHPSFGQVGTLVKIFLSFCQTQRRDGIVSKEVNGAPAGTGVQYLYSLVTQYIGVSRHFKSFVKKKKKKVYCVAVGTEENSRPVRTLFQI